MPVLKLYAHPFASYCQKVLIALYENDTAFEYRALTAEHPETFTELEALWPFKLFPVLADGDRMVAEASIIIEHLQLHHPGPARLIPENPRAAIEARFMDRVFDNYIATPQAKFVFDKLRPAESRDPFGVGEARARLDTAYRWLDKIMAGRAWAAGDAFSLADCAAAPALFYADWTHPTPQAFANLRAYRQRLLARPSFARAVDEARPYRALPPPRALASGEEPAGNLIPIRANFEKYRDDLSMSWPARGPHRAPRDGVPVSGPPSNRRLVNFAPTCLIPGL